MGGGEFFKEKLKLPPYFLHFGFPPTLPMAHLVPSLTWSGRP